MSRPIKKIAITGAAGQIAYSLIFRIASGELLGKDQPVALHLLDLADSMQALQGVVMELEDCAFPLLKNVVTGSDPYKVFEGVELVFLVGARPRGPGMERKDLLSENGKIFVEQGKALETVAAADAISLVVGNPCNTNCLIASSFARRLDRRRFFAMTRLDQNRAASFLATKASVGVEDISGITIWGNHSSTQVPDVLNARVLGRPAYDVITDHSWLKAEFFQKVQKRGAEVIAARGKSSAASAANAALDAMRSIILPTPQGQWFSMALFSNGNPYGIKEELIFSFPCTSHGGGRVEIVPDLKLDPFLQEKIALTQKELLEEKALIESMLNIS